MGNPFDPTQHHQPHPDGGGDEPTRFVTPQQPQQPFGQQQPWPGDQPHPGQQPYGTQPYPGQPYPGQSYPGQPYPGAPQQPGGYPPPGFGGTPPPGMPPGMPPAPGGYPGGPGGMPPRISRNKWLAAGATVVVIIVVIALVAFFWPASGKKESNRPAPNASAQELLIAQSDFPHLDGADFSTSGASTDSSTGSSDGSDSSTPKVTADNPECEKLMQASDNSDSDSSVDQHSAELTSTGDDTSSLGEKTYAAEVKKTIDPDFTTNFDTIMSKCSSFGITMKTDYTDVKGDVTMTRLMVDGVDGSYNGVEMKMTMHADDGSSDITIHGTMRILMAVSRSVSYDVTYQEMSSESAPDISSSVNGDLASMLNKQRQRILDAK